MGPLTVTAERQEVVDFTQVFQTVQLSAVVNRQLLRDSISDDSTLFNFFSNTFHVARPLSGTVWLLLLCVAIIVTITLHVIDQLSTRSTHHPGDLATIQGQCHNQSHLGLINSIWCTVTTMFLMTSSANVRQSAESRSVFARLVITVVWCFSLFVVTSYTANMAALLTSTRQSKTIAGNTPIFQRLMMQSTATKWRIFTASGSDVSALLSTDASVDELIVNEDIGALLKHRTRWSYVDDVESGLQMVLDQPNVIFIHDSSILEYQLREQNHCAKLEVVSVYKTVDSVGYAIGMPKRSGHTAALNLALSRLAKDGTLRSLRRK